MEVVIGAQEAEAVFPKSRCKAGKQHVNPALFPSQLLVEVWSMYWPLMDLITFLQKPGLPELPPLVSSLAVLWPPSWTVGWRTAEFTLVLTGAPSAFSASRFNSRACCRWVMCLDLGRWESVFMPLWQANAQESFPSCILLVNHPRDPLLTRKSRKSGMIHLAALVFLLPYQLLRKS